MIRKLMFSLLILALSVSSVFANDTTTLNLNLNGLTDLGSDYNYEGWIIVDGAPVSTGIFNIDANGDLTQSAFEVAAAHADAAAAFVLTIEPANDPDPAPAATHVVAGDFAGSNAALSVGHPAALGNNFASASGGFILAAPSAPDASYVNGLWYLQNGEAALNLPTLPEGWAYEGWIAGSNGPISTGTFTDVAAPDSDGGGPTAGPNATPPFPGQDFVNPAIDLTAGYAAVISIEPVPDNSPAPFDYKPLLDVNIDDVKAAGGFQRLQQNLGSLATGTASFSNAAPAAPAAPAPAAPASAAPAPIADNVAVFNTVVGNNEPGPAFPGDAYEFSFTAARGERLNFATMLVQTNDWFFSPSEWGIPVYDNAGNPKSGDITDYVHLYDSGTEIDETPGVGAYQAPRQPDANTGPVDNNRQVRRAHDNSGKVPAVNQLIKVTLTHDGGENFTVRIENVSGSSSFGSPIAPGVAVITADFAPIFQTTFYDRGLGLEALAEDGNPSILAANLR